LRIRQAIDVDKQIRIHFVAEDDAGTVRGYGAIEQWPEDDTLRVYVVGAPENIQTGMGDLIYEYLMQSLEGLEVRLLWVREESQDPIVDFFREKGFYERQHFMLDNGREATVLNKVIAKKD
jgi:hypothetical protein